MSSKDDPKENLLNNKGCRNATEETAGTPARVRQRSPSTAGSSRDGTQVVRQVFCLLGHFTSSTVSTSNGHRIPFLPIQASYAPRVGRLGR